MAYDQFGKDTEMIVQDSSSFAAEGERISFLQVQVHSSSLPYVALVVYNIDALRTILMSWSQFRHDCLPAATSAGRVITGHREAVPAHCHVNALRSSASWQCIL